MHTHTYTYIYIHIHTYAYRHTYIHMHTRTYTYIYIHMHTDIHTYICIHIHIHTYTYICIQTYIHTYAYRHADMQTCRPGFQNTGYLGGVQGNGDLKNAILETAMSDESNRPMAWLKDIVPTLAESAEIRIQGPNTLYSEATIDPMDLLMVDKKPPRIIAEAVVYSPFVNPVNDHTLYGGRTTQQIIDTSVYNAAALINCAFPAEGQEGFSQASEATALSPRQLGTLHSNRVALLASVSLTLPAWSPIFPCRFCLTMFFPQNWWRDMQTCRHACIYIISYHVISYYIISYNSNQQCIHIYIYIYL